MTVMSATNQVLLLQLPVLLGNSKGVDLDRTSLCFPGPPEAIGSAEERGDEQAVWALLRAKQVLKPPLSPSADEVFSSSASSGWSSGISSGPYSPIVGLQYLDHPVRGVLAANPRRVRASS